MINIKTIAVPKTSGTTTSTTSGTSTSTTVDTLNDWFYWDEETQMLRCKYPLFVNGKLTASDDIETQGDMVVYGDIISRQ